MGVEERRERERERERKREQRERQVIPANQGAVTPAPTSVNGAFPIYHSLPSEFNKKIQDGYISTSDNAIWSEAMDPQL